ncbi:MAG: alpha/beta hydrolase [Burkholderiaceae bacterium]|nr:alpha/beta hydrolase [Burkholderiaceae bacterium]
MTASIETFDAALPHGITLSCRACGGEGAPRVVLLHGFPEAAFAWDDVMQRLAGRARCVAPNLRGYERSSAPTEVEAYRARHLVADVKALVDRLGGTVDLLVAHDWGGAVAWNFAVQHPASLRRLLIVNAPHPATFLRDLRSSPAQQSASAYMNFLCRPDAETLLAENDYARLWPFFTTMGAADVARPGGGWLTPEVRQQYRAVWRRGLTGPLNYYRASPLRPPTAADSPVMSLQWPPEAVTVRVPTTVLWGEADSALPPGLLDGLDAFVPDLRVERVADASHWIVHERPALVADTIAALLRQDHGRPR